MNLLQKSIVSASSGLHPCPDLQLAELPGGGTHWGLGQLKGWEPPRTHLSGGVFRQLVPRSSGTSSCASVMACGLVASNLNLKPGECLRVRGEVAPDAKSFVLNLGKDSDNLCLHFNPRFNMHGDANTIVCNSKDGGAWGTEQRESAFPFQPGSVMEVCISFDKADLTITLPDGYSFKFPNRLNLEAVNYLSANGDFKIKCVAFE
uniref:Galectin n=1 Tax=Equus asinus TaxID=9793 RepID=A0A9L0K1Q6_EQUAS